MLLFDIWTFRVLVQLQQYLPVRLHFSVVRLHFKDSRCIVTCGLCVVRCFVKFSSVIVNFSEKIYKIYRERGLTMEEITAILRESSNNQSVIIELSGMHDENFMPVVYNLDWKAMRILKLMILRIRRNCDSLQKECVSGSKTGRLATQNILRESNGLLSYTKGNVNNNNVLSIWSFFTDRIVLEHIMKCTNQDFAEYYKMYLVSFK